MFKFFLIYDMIEIVGDSVKSRMDKYYKDEDVMQRTSKNDTLYEELYREKQMPRSNITVIDNVNEIDITKIKSMVDSREKYKRVRDYEKIINPMDTYRKSEINYEFDEIDNSNYDINEILKNKRSNKTYDTTKVRRITNVEYDIMSRPNEDISEDMNNPENQMIDLFNTLSRTAVREETDLFSNLREDTSIVENKEPKEEEFYTNTTRFESEDFLEDVKENNNSKIFIIIGVIALIIATIIVIYLKFFSTT